VEVPFTAKILLSIIIIVGQKFLAEDFIVRAGFEIKYSGGTLAKVASIGAHEMFEVTNFNHDISVMRLSEALELTNKVQTISLAEKTPARGTPAFSSGWGFSSLEFNHVDGSVEFTSPVNLQGVRLQFVGLYCNDIENT